jgi:hypothetical protein
LWSHQRQGLFNYSSLVLPSSLDQEYVNV